MFLTGFVPDDRFFSRIAGARWLIHARVTNARMDVVRSVYMAGRTETELR
jgi:hypothetical protein